MKVIEYGCSNSRTIILLHGGGLSWWSCRETAEQLAEDFRIVLPILDGHADSEENFTSIEDNAARIVRFIDEHFGGSVLLVGGLSLGAQILVEMLCQRKDICSFAVVESALVLPMKMTYRLAGPMINMSYGLIKQRWFSKLQFRSLGLKADLYDEYYRDTCKITKKNMTAFLKANARYEPKPDLACTEAMVHLFAGEKEQPVMIKSARRLHGMIPKSRLEIMHGLHHGDFSINCAAEYAECLRNIIEDEKR